MTRSERLDEAIRLTCDMAETMDLTPGERVVFRRKMEKALAYFISTALPKFGGAIVTERDFSASDET